MAGTLAGRGGSPLMPTFLGLPPASVEPVAARLEKMRIIKIRPSVIT
jgi:hypothetical protein